MSIYDTFEIDLYRYSGECDSKMPQLEDVLLNTEAMTEHVH